MGSHLAKWFTYAYSSCRLLALCLFDFSIQLVGLFKNMEFFAFALLAYYWYVGQVLMRSCLGYLFCENIPSIFDFYGWWNGVVMKVPTGRRYTVFIAYKHGERVHLLGLKAPHGVGWWKTGLLLLYLR